MNKFVILKMSLFPSESTADWKIEFFFLLLKTNNTFFMSILPSSNVSEAVLDAQSICHIK